MRNIFLALTFFFANLHMSAAYAGFSTFAEVCRRKNCVVRCYTADHGILPCRSRGRIRPAAGSPPIALVQCSLTDNPGSLGCAQNDQAANAQFKSACANDEEHYYNYMSPAGSTSCRFISSMPMSVPAQEVTPTPTTAAPAPEPAATISAPAPAPEAAPASLPVSSEGK